MPHEYKHIIALIFKNGRRDKRSYRRRADAKHYWSDMDHSTIREAWMYEGEEVKRHYYGEVTI